MAKFASVEMRLSNMLYISYLVPVARVRPLVPEGLSLALACEGKVFVSLVIFRGETRQGLGIPSPRIPFDQINIRTYVTDPVTGGPSVYFVRCGIGGALITFLYRLVSGMPVEHTPFSIRMEKGRTAGDSAYEVAGTWRGSVSILASHENREVGEIPPFATVKEGIGHLIDPLAGFYIAYGSLLRLEVYHAPLVPFQGRVSHVGFPYLTELGIVEKEDLGRPESVLYVPETPFLIYLPPRKMRAPGR